MMKARFVQQPKLLFLLDGLGALISAYILGVVLVKFESIFRIPENTLYFLTIFPVFFALFDFYAFRKVKYKAAILLKIIAALNISYCFLSIIVAMVHADVISAYGWGYLALELAIILILAFIEYMTAKKIEKEIIS